MKKKSRNRKTGRRGGLLFLVALIILFAGSSGLSYLYFRDKFAFESSFIKGIESRQAYDTLSERGEGLDRLYGGEEQDVLVSAEDFIRDYMSSYDAALLDLYLDKHGIIYIDFGGGINNNFKGDVAEEMNMIAGLYRGLDRIVKGLSKMKILIDGREAETIGGHVLILRPIGADIVSGVS